MVIPVLLLLLCVLWCLPSAAQQIILSPGAGGSGGVPGGTSGQLQWNTGSAFGGTTGLVFDATSPTLATSGWKFGPNGLSATLTNPDVGNDPNFRRGIALTHTSDASLLNPVFSTEATLSIARSTTGPGQNSADAVAKTTFTGLSITSQDQAQGQHFNQTNTIQGWAMGDVFSADHTVYVWGGTNAGGDEGQAALRLAIDQPGPITRTTIQAKPAQSTCNTTLTQTVTKSITPQAVTVASTTGCAVNDRVVIDAGDFLGSKPRMELVKITAVGGGTITGQFRENHASGVTVQAAVLLGLTSGSNLGAGRYLVNYTTPAYTTGTVSAISARTFTGTGTSWAATMVGGTALLPGCIALTSDDYSGPPFQGANGPLKGWHGIAPVTDATHLDVAHFREASHPAAYVGNGVGTGAYTIRACARVLEVSSNTVWLEPNSFGWTVGDTVVLAHSVDLSIPGVIRAQMFIYNPNAYVQSVYSAANYGARPIRTVLSVSQGLAENDATAAGFGNIVSSTAITASATLNTQGKALDGEWLNAYTYTGDNKLVKWRASTGGFAGSASVGMDHVTGNLLLTGARVVTSMTMEAAAFQSTGVAFASLGTPANGTFLFCQDCVLASNPCTGGGTGSLARRLNGGWVC